MMYFFQTTWKKYIPVSSGKLYKNLTYIYIQHYVTIYEENQGE
jgi:hypothetical protein